MRELALFAGAGGGLLGSRLLGWTTVCAVELDPYRRRVLEQRIADGIFEPFEIGEDVRTFDAKRWLGRVDVISGGFPCQGWSPAGRRLGEKDPRNLWPETAGIVARVRPSFVFFENTARLAGTRYFHEVILNELEALGFAVAWLVLRASDIGAPHLRARVWIVGVRLSDAGTHELRLERRRRKAWSRAPWARDYRAAGALADAHPRRCEGERSGGLLDGERPSLRDDTDGCRGADVVDTPQARLSDLCGSASGKELNRRRAAVDTGGGPWNRDPADAETSSESYVGRVAHGVADRRHRLAALGDGQVPLVAATAWRLLAGRIGLT